MAKHDDTLSERASKQAVEATQPEPSPRLRKVPGRVTEQDFDVIRDAISLKRALLAGWLLMPDEGAILTIICQEWLKSESARLSGKGGGDRT